MTESRHRKAFEEFAELAREELGDSLRKLVLYGSVARGEETEESDVDVFAVVETMDQKKWIQQRGAEIGVEYGLMMSVIARTEEEFEKTRNSVYGKNLLEEGEVYV